MERSSGIIVAGLFAALVAGGFFVFFAMHGRARENEITILGQQRPSSAVVSPMSAPSAREDAPKDIVVHVIGAVKKPGVYHFKPGARVEEAIAAASGQTSEANLNAINLAAKLDDGTQLHVPTKKESTAEQAPNSGSEAYENAPSAAIAHRSSAHSSKFSQPGKQFVNINTAGEADLQQLPGVGPAMAARIIQHRKENGPFSDPEQLQDVSGIGPKKYEKMRPYVKVH